jgi:1,2-diacylglycerol 3-alpha-glucosyltransferase
MKIVHICLSCFYIDGYSYQENLLVQQNVADGHEVLVIASTQNYNDARRITYVEPSTYMGKDGARVIRLPYRKFLPQKMMQKLRMHPGVYELLEREKPNAVLFHGLCGYELKTAAAFKRRHPKIPVYADSHEDQNNSARTLGSKLLHKYYYRPIISAVQASFDKILCISVETITFVRSMYGVPAERLEFYPLGGVIVADEEYELRRDRARKSLRLESQHILFLQTGKLGKRKRLVESLNGFARVAEKDFRLVIVGELDSEIQMEANLLIAQDKRVSFLGWKNSDELLDLLCATDVYLQPGTQSATMQMSLCARCPVILDDVPSHQPFVNGNGWLIKSPDELPDVFQEIAENPERLADMSLNSAAIAARLLDYKVLASRFLTVSGLNNARL